MGMGLFLGTGQIKRTSATFGQQQGTKKTDVAKGQKKRTSATFGQVQVTNEPYEVKGQKDGQKLVRWQNNRTSKRKGWAKVGTWVQALGRKKDKAKGGGKFPLVITLGRGRNKLVLS